MRKWILPLIHDVVAIAGSNFHVLASPWSPPGWMKTNGMMPFGGSLQSGYADTWAKFIVKFVQAMKREENIPIWALTVQNEPAARQFWESCIYTAEQERDFVRNHLGPSLTKAGLEQIHLLIWDHNRDLLNDRASTVLSDPVAARYVWGAALHWYVSRDFSQSSLVHEAYPDKHLLFTEGCYEGGTHLGQWDHGEYYARNMIGDFRNWVCGWIDWNIALDNTGGPNHAGNFCDAPVIIDPKSGDVRYQSSFFYIAQFSRFVHPGAHRIVSLGSPSGLQSVAFINPDTSLIVIALNEQDQPADFT